MLEQPSIVEDGRSGHSLQERRHLSGMTPKRLVLLTLAFVLITIVLYVSQGSDQKEQIFEFREAEVDFCEHTVQGKHLIADDRGYVCNYSSFDHTSGCCSNVEVVDRYTCEVCNQTAQCCSTFEHCVSCCLSPTPYQQERLKSILTRDSPLFQLTATLFDFCSATCRTSSVSLHQNRYRHSGLKHCYGVELPHLEDLESPAAVVASNLKGEEKKDSRSALDERAIVESIEDPVVDSSPSLKATLAVGVGLFFSVLFLD